MHRRTRSLAASTAVLTLLGVLATGPAASAVEPPPPPVVPAQTLPSTYSRIFTGSGLMDDQIKMTAWMLQQVRAGSAGTAVGTAVAEGAAITAPGTLSAGAVGGVVTAGFMGGWLITDGTLAIYTATTGTDPMAGTCSQPDWAQAAIGVLYPFSSPDCTVTFTTPNAGITPGFTPLSYGGWTATYTGRYDGPSSSFFCYSVGPTWTDAPPGELKATSQDGGQVAVGLAFGMTAVCGADRRGISAYRTGGPTVYALTPALRLVHFSTGATLATMTALSADPGRIPKCDLTWPDGSHTVTTGAAYHESAGLPLNSFQGLCNEGFVSKPGHGPALLPTGIEIGSTNEDTGAYTEIADQPVPDFTETERKGLEPGTSGGLVLQKVVGTVVSSCMNWDADCGGWWDDTESGTVPTTDTGTYRCLFNGSAVDLDECGIYRRTFDTRTGTPTVTEPSTGEETEWVSGEPDPGPFPIGGAAPSPADSCYSSWPSAPDPITWVQYPIRCELVRAFVPRTAVVTAFQDGVTGSWNESAPGKLAASIASVSAAFGTLGAGNCGGIVIPFPGGVSSTGAPIVESRSFLAACPGDFFAPIAPVFFWLISGSILITGFFGARRFLDRLVNNT